jgi:HEPN domain-containing protein
MPDLEHTRLMLRLSKDDLAALAAIETSHSPRIVAFHAQQAAKKALKA